MMRVRAIPSIPFLFVLLLLLFVFLLPSITYVHADEPEDDPPTKIPTLTPITTQPPTIQTPTTRTPTTQTPTTRAPTIRTPTTQAPAPTTITPVIPTGTGGGAGMPTGTGLNPTIPPPTMRPPPPPAATPCAKRGSCSACTMDTQCSWCADTGADTGTCVAQQTLCTTRGGRTFPSTTCAAPAFNPFLLQAPQAQQAAQPSQAVELGTITPTNTQVSSNNKLLQDVDPNLDFVYIQLDVLTPNAAALMLRLQLQQPDGKNKEIQTSTVLATGQQFVTIRPGTNRECFNLGTKCNFVIQVTQAPATNTNSAKSRGVQVHTTAVGDPIDFKLTFTRGQMRALNGNSQFQSTIVNDAAVFLGLEFLSTSLDVQLTLIPDQGNPNTDLDLFVAHMTTVNNPQGPDHQVGRGTNARESFLITNGIPVPLPQGQLGFYIIAVVPAQNDTMQKPFTLDIVKNFKQEFVIAVATLAIIAAIAVFVLCIITAVAVIAKRRRRALAAQAAAAAAAQAFVNPAPAGPVGVTPEELELIPIHSFEKNIEASSDDSLCSICLCDYDVGQPVRTLACLHHFHTSCVDPWLKDHRTCPNCRKDATEGLKVSSSSSEKNDSDAPLSVVVEPNSAPAPLQAPLPSPRGLGASVTYVGSGSGSASGSGSHYRASGNASPMSANGDRAFSPMDIEAHFPQYAATQSSGSSSSSHPSYPSYGYPSPSPHDSSMSGRRLSQPREPWQDMGMAPGMPQGQE